MSKPPHNPEIFHITHLDNLASVLEERRLWCDAEARKRVQGAKGIGYSHIKDRRLIRRVETTAGGFLGDYVPFNFCSRSVMLYVVKQGHEGYVGGQSKIVHLVSSMQTATGLGRDWAFTDRHADLGYASFFEDLDDLDQVNWEAMAETWWTKVKEERQAEFLVRKQFPWSAVERIGVYDEDVKTEVEAQFAAASHTPPVEVQRSWYY